MMSSLYGHHYLLRLKVPSEMRDIYNEAIVLHNKNIERPYFDAGFDLICPEDIEVLGNITMKINLGVSGSMTYIPISSEGCCCCSQVPVGYFIYPRSSTGTKTNLRLANSVGVIDSGYRGNYIAAFDNVRSDTIKVEKGQRLVQICAPNLMYPIRVEIVDDLGEKTSRDVGGFGSTGS